MHSEYGADVLPNWLINHRSASSWRPGSMLGHLVILIVLPIPVPAARRGLRAQTLMVSGLGALIVDVPQRRRNREPVRLADGHSGLGLRIDGCRRHK
jgi:hypothetical protein